MIKYVDLELILQSPAENNRDIYCKKDRFKCDAKLESDFFLFLIYCDYIKSILWPSYNVLCVNQIAMVYFSQVTFFKKNPGLALLYILQGTKCPYIQNKILNVLLVLRYPLASFPKGKNGKHGGILFSVTFHKS